MRTSDDTQLRESDQFVEQLRTAIQSGFLNVGNARELLRVVLRQKMWKHRIVLMTEQPRDYVDFLRFVTDAPYDGLGTTIGTLETLAHGDTELTSLLDQATQRPPGGNNNPDGSNQHTQVNGLKQSIDHKRDRSEQNSRRLRKDFSALHNQVLSGQKTVTEAAIEAGIYPKRISISTTSAHSAASSIRQNCDQTFIEELTELLAGSR